MNKKRVSELLDVNSDVIVEYLSEDNRDIKANTLFFALSGAAFDAHNVIDEVIKKGAKVIVHSKDLANYQDGIIYYKTDNVNRIMAQVATRFFDNPSNRFNLIGVTGTNGKTTTSWILYDILNRISTAGYIGTISIEYNNKEYSSHYTTPKPIELNYHFDQMIKQGIKNCAIEVSSHALSLDRSKYLNFKYAIMTNLSFEHINFHGNMKNYQDAKRILFEDLTEDSFAILNVDDITYEDYVNHTKAQVVSYGIENKADVQAKDLILNNNGMSFTLVYENKEYQINSNLVSRVNVYNLLAALAVLLKMNIEINKIIELVKEIKPPEGRMSVIKQGQDFDVIVDYAHTPDGFEKLYDYVKDQAKGNIISVFGSAGGDRDREKRPVLGKIASQYSNHIILTQEDNRSESVHDIAMAIADGIVCSYEIIEDRKQAIIKALKMAQPNDLVLILAKGNEKYQHVGNQTFDYEGDIDLTTRLLKEGVHNEE